MLVPRPKIRKFVFERSQLSNYYRCALLCIALLYDAWLCSALLCIAVRFFALLSDALYRFALHCFALFYIALCCVA